MVAQRPVRQAEGGDQRQKLEDSSENRTHLGGSEPLRLDEGEDEVAQQGGGHEQADDVLGTHSFATPLAMNATSAKTAIVVTTKAASAIVSSR
ncbi:hypothetical protein GCM10017667_34460 [Streptomyces filamentosus]|uniref:Uncharacterized protein n=1 Tax=Streptomyces filamentosus TaxID=67294 RepID=A0A919BLW3_STRFL|nr:hypothetical protein GCM10017667_34460 [Streptomyces filamentosus]